MKELYIKDKINKLMDFKEYKNRLHELEVNREIARIGNLLANQLDIVLVEAKNKMISFTQHVLKEELK